MLVKHIKLTLSEADYTIFKSLKKSFGIDKDAPALRFLIKNWKKRERLL